MYVSLNEEDRIIATVEKAEYLVDCFEFDFPYSFDFNKQDEYKIINSQLIHDPLPIDPSIHIAELKQKLADTDYIVIKQAEGVVLSEEENARYTDILQQRQQWREEINRLTQ